FVQEMVGIQRTREMITKLKDDTELLSGIVLKQFEIVRMRCRAGANRQFGIDLRCDGFELEQKSADPDFIPRLERGGHAKLETIQKSPIAGPKIFDEPGTPFGINTGMPAAHICSGELDINTRVPAQNAVGSGEFKRFAGFRTVNDDQAGHGSGAG